jgi:hypothetical protein
MTNTATVLTLTDRLALFAYIGSGRQARIWARKGEQIAVEVTDGMWGVTYKGRKYTAVPRYVMAATAPKA